eukprot:214762-Chlamydomonas_euryale.AAC.3
MPHACMQFHQYRMHACTSTMRAPQTPYLSPRAGPCCHSRVFERNAASRRASNGAAVVPAHRVGVGVDGLGSGFGGGVQGDELAC